MTEKSEWRDIASAPRDGTEFQAWVTDGEISQGFWEPRCRFEVEFEAFQIWGRVDYDEEGWDEYGRVRPTHWMPAPEPPHA